MKPSLSDIAGELNLAARQKHGLAAPLLPPLLLLSDETRVSDPGADLAALPSGSGFIFRHYSDPHRNETARRLHNIAQASGIVFLVAADPDLARALGADGCHLPEHQRSALAFCQQHFALNTVAAHSEQALQAAANAGASAALLSPVFPTASHPGATPLGAERARSLASTALLPVYALGGINTATAPGLVGSAFCGLAAIDSLRASKDA